MMPPLRNIVPGSYGGFVAITAPFIVKLPHVPYRDSAPAVVDLLAGQIQVPEFITEVVNSYINIYRPVLWATDC